MEKSTTIKIKLASLCYLIGILWACTHAVPFPSGPSISPGLSPPRATPAEESARVYKSAREKYAGGDYAGSLSLISIVRSRSNPPRLDRAEAMVLDAMWGRVIELYKAKDYDGALQTVAIFEKRARPPELMLAKGIILFYAGNLEGAATALLDDSLADDPRALATLGFVYFEKNNRELAASAWSRALSSDPRNRMAVLGTSIVAFNEGDSSWREGFTRSRGEVAILPPRLKEAGWVGSILAAMRARMPARLAVVHRVIPAGASAGLDGGGISLGQTFLIQLKIKNLDPDKNLDHAGIFAAYGASLTQRVRADGTFKIRGGSETGWISLPEIVARRQYTAVDGQVIPVHISIRQEPSGDPVAEHTIDVPINRVDPKPPRFPMDIYVIFRSKIYMTGETLTTDTGSITFDSFRLDLGDVSLGSPQNVTFTLFGPSGEAGRVAKGTRELQATKPVGARSTKPTRGRTFENLKISGLEIGLNRLTVAAMDRQGRKQTAHVIIKRVEIGYQKFAILMGVREYLWDPRWEASFVDRDLAGLKDVLVRQGYRVRTVVNPTIDQLEMMVRRLRSPNSTFSDDDGKQISLGDNDDVIVYYSGHGFRVNPGMPNEFGYLVPYGAVYNPDSGRPEDEGCLPMDDLVNSLKFSRARHKLLILDTCYAALAGTAKSPPDAPRSCDRDYIEQRGLFLMAASERDEKSWMYRHMRQSAFTRLLVDALNGQTSEENGGCLTLFDIAGYITGRLENQNPVFRFLSTGNGMPYFEKFNN